MRLATAVSQGPSCCAADGGMQACFFSVAPRLQRVTQPTFLRCIGPRARLHPRVLSLRCHRRYLACSLLRCRRDLRLCRVRLVFHRWSARPIRCAADCQHQFCALARFSVRTVRRRRAALCRPPACGAHVSFSALQDARNRSITAEVMLRCWAACRCRQARVRAQPHHCAATLAHREYLPPVDAIAKGRGPVGDGRCAPPD